MPQICDSVMHAAAASWRGRNTVMSWQPVAGDTSGVATTFASVGRRSGISTMEIFRCEA